eukprot:2129153-Prymnesium_polylepis.1
MGTRAGPCHTFHWRTRPHLYRPLSRPAAVTLSNFRLRRSPAGESSRHTKYGCMRSWRRAASAIGWL